MLDLLFEPPVPSVRRRHRSEHVHACGEMLVDERTGELSSSPVGDGGQDNQQISHDLLTISLVLLPSFVVLFCSTWQRANRAPNAPGHLEQLNRNRAGVSFAGCWCSWPPSSSSTASSAKEDCWPCCARGSSTRSSPPPSNGSGKRTRGCAKPSAA